MKRDWDVIRVVLIEIESLPHEGRAQFGYGIGTDQSPEARSKAEHAFLLRDAGFVSAFDADTLEANAVIGPELTWSGHDLLDTLRSKPVWDRIKVTAQEKGIELTFEAVKALGAVALKSIVGS